MRTKIGSHGDGMEEELEEPASALHDLNHAGSLALMGEIRRIDGPIGARPSTPRTALLALHLVSRGRVGEAVRQQTHGAERGSAAMCRRSGSAGNAQRGMFDVVGLCAVRDEGPGTRAYAGQGEGRTQSHSRPRYSWLSSYRPRPPAEDLADCERDVALDDILAPAALVVWRLGPTSSYLCSWSVPSADHVDHVTW